MRNLIIVLGLIAICYALDTDVSVEGASRIRIVSEFHSLPVVVVSGENIPKGTASVIVGADTSVRVDDISSSIKDDYVEILISGSEDSSDSASFSFPSSSDATPALKPLSCLVIVGFAFCMLKKHQSVLFLVILGLLATAYANIDTTDQRILISLSSEDNFEEVEIISPNSYVLIAPEFVEDCSFGTDERNLDDCFSLVCDVEDDNCISDNFLHVGALLPFSSDRGEQYLQTLYLAANRYGTSSPLVQMIVADSGETSEAAINGAQKLIQHGCEYFVGPLFSGQAHDVLDYLESQNIDASMISPEASSSELEDYENFFSIFAENNDLATAICQNALYEKDAGLNTLNFYVIGIDTEYAENLIELVRTDCGQQIKVEFVGLYDVSVNSVDGVRDVVRSLNNALEQESNLDLALVLHVGFSDLRYVLQALDLEKGRATQVEWFSTDSTFDDSSVPSSLRDDTADLALRGFQYLGFNVESSVSVRDGLLRHIFQTTGGVSFPTTFIHDAAMLMYLSLSSMGSQQNQHLLFPSTVKTISEITYGASGYLAMSDVGFRKQNEYILGRVIVESNSPFDTTWWAYQYLKTTGSEKLFGQRGAFFNSVFYITPDNLEKPCDDYVIEGHTYDVLGLPISYRFSKEDAESTNILIPVFYESSLNVMCQGERLSYDCPPSANELVRACSVILEDNEKFTFTCAMAIGGTVGGIIYLLS